jgi:cell wall hydrolase
MNRRRRRKLRRILWTAWQYVKLVAVLLFAMAAGAACYHQYLVQHRQIPIERKWEQEIRLEMVQMSREVAAEAPEPIVCTTAPDDIEKEERMDELELMAICIEAEAGNQDLTGKRMAADVILNRVDDPDFPDTITDVISQKYAFTSFWDGGMDKVVEPSEETFLAVRMELEERGWPGLLYFTAGEWPKYGTPWKKVGDHYFSTK